MKLEEIKTNLFEQFKDKECSEAEFNEAVTKALAAGYETSTPATEVKVVEAAANLEAAVAPVEVPVAETPKKEVKFAPGLFGGSFSLGSTLAPGHVGNVITNVKAPRK